MSRVSSRRALARSFSGSVPQASVRSLTRLGSIWPGPVPLPPLLSFCGLLARRLLFGLPLLLLPPLGQEPPLELLWLFFWFSISLMISSRRRTTSRCICCVLGPPRDRSRRRSILPILRAIQPRSLSFQDR